MLVKRVFQLYSYTLTVNMTMSKNRNRRPQAPKRRNYVAKHAREFQRSHVHRDRTKYDRYEDYLQDQLDDYLNDDYPDEWDELEEAKRKEEFMANLSGEDYELREEWEKYKEGLVFDEALNAWVEDWERDLWDDYDY